MSQLVILLSIFIAAILNATPIDFTCNNGAACSCSNGDCRHMCLSNECVSKYFMCPSSATSCIVDCYGTHACKDTKIYGAADIVILNCNGTNSCDGTQLLCGRPNSFPNNYLSRTYNTNQFNGQIKDCFVNLLTPNAMSFGDVTCDGSITNCIIEAYDYNSISQSLFECKIANTNGNGCELNCLQDSNCDSIDFKCNTLSHCSCGIIDKNCDNSNVYLTTEESQTDDIIEKSNQYNCVDLVPTEVKIKSILKIKTGEKFKEYQILKLYVDVPEPIKYIRSCKAYGNIKLARVKPDGKHNKPNEQMNNIRRRLNEWNNEIDFDAMIEEEFLSGILSTLKDKASNAYNFIKKTGGNIKSVSSVLGSVISPGSVSNEKNLLDIHKKQDYKWDQHGELKDKKVSITDGGPNLIMNGKGDIELGVGYHIDLAIDLEYKMDWDLKNGLIEIQIVIYGYFDIGAYFNAKLNGEFDIQINDLLKIAPKFTFFLGPIPITVQPYIHLKKI